MPSDGAAGAPISVKIVVSGGYGVGKTSFMGAVSDIAPLRTEADVSAASERLDGVVEGKRTTTVALDFGRIRLADGLFLYLFGTPGQDRFAFMWDDLVRGAFGAVVLVDTGRLQDCFAAVDHLERNGVPFIVAVNRFDAAPRHGLEQVRDALGVGADVPVVACDARSRDSVRDVLVTLTEVVLARRPPAYAR